MLVIPIIHLQSGACVRRRENGFGKEAEFFEDPVRMAKLWRVMNAPALHLIEHDHDGDAGTHEEQSAASVAEMSRALDIPLQLSGRFSDHQAIEAWFERGIRRIILDPKEDIEEVRELSGACSVKRLVPSLVLGDIDEPDRAYADLACRRLFVWLPANFGEDDVERLRGWGRLLPGVRFTVANGVSGYGDLLKLEALEPPVDSLVLGRVLYENAFPCQGFWCWHQKQSVDLERYSTAPLAS